MAQAPHAPGGPFPLPCPARRSRRLSISACATSAMRCPTAACCWKTPATISAWRATASSAATARARRCCCDCCSANCLRNPAASSVADASPPCRSPCPPAGVTLADVAGMTPALRALARIEAGTGSQADFDLMDGRWRVREEWPRMLADAGLPAWPPERPASAVSGGELTRVALAGALAHRRTAAGRAHQSSGRPRPGWLMDRLTTWRGGLIVASHDRTLLDTMSDIVALERGALAGHAGNYSAYRRHHEQQAASADAALAHARAERDAGLRALRQRHDAEQRRGARNARQARDANQAPILLGMKKASAERHAGRERLRMQAAAQALDAAVRQASAAVAPAAAIALALPETAVPAGRRVLHLEAATPPWPAGAPACHCPLSGPIRLALQGPNGCGKSTLLAMLAGELAPSAGAARSACRRPSWTNGPRRWAMPRRCCKRWTGSVRGCPWANCAAGLPCWAWAPPRWMRQRPGSAAAKDQGGAGLRAVAAGAGAIPAAGRTHQSSGPGVGAGAGGGAVRLSRRAGGGLARRGLPGGAAAHASARLGKREMDGRNGGAGLTPGNPECPDSNESLIIR